MLDRRKSHYPQQSQFNAYLAGWAFAASVVFATLLLIARNVI
jgi:hypothetical protein